MKHIDNYSVILHKKENGEYETIAILTSATKENIRYVIVNCFIEWCYDEDENSLKTLDNIVESLYGDNYYEDEFDVFKMEETPFFE
jgi:hypothetical protein